MNQPPKNGQDNNNIKNNGVGSENEREIENPQPKNSSIGFLVLSVVITLTPIYLYFQGVEISELLNRKKKILETIEELKEEQELEEI